MCIACEIETGIPYATDGTGHVATAYGSGSDPAVNNHVQSSNTFIKGLQSSLKWSETGGVFLSYGFATTTAHLTHIQNNSTDIYPDISGFSGAYNPLSSGTGIDAALVADIQEALRAISSVADITFTESTFDGSGTDLKFASFANLADTNGNLNGIATFPTLDPHPTGGEGFESFIFLSSTPSSMTTDPLLGASSNRLNTTMHEIGHGLGLTHPQDTFEGDAWTIGAVSGPGDHPMDNNRYSIMAAERGGLDTNTQNLQFGYAVTPMALDVAALQQMYGSAANHTGSTSYTLLDPEAFGRDLDGEDGFASIGRAFYCIWDTGGTDVINYSGANHALINLNEATLDVNGDPAHITDILSRITATSLFQSLSQELKDDLANNDFHAGGFFSRVFFGNGVAALGGFSIASAAFASASHAAGAVIENATGGDNADMIIGNEQSNFLTANGGNDVVHGGSGADTIYGGAGADIIFAGAIGGNDGDFVDGGAAFDTIHSSGSGTYYGGSEGDTMYAGLTDLTGSLTEFMNGEGGSDTLDTTTFNFPGIVYTINLFTGFTNYVEERFVNFENVISGATTDTITGTDGVNIVYSGAGSDTLFGEGDQDTLYAEGGNDFLYGGFGTDFLYGGADNDSYYILSAARDASDQIIEGLNQGFDTVYAFANFSITPFANVERMIAQGTTVTALVGNTEVNYFYTDRVDQAVRASGGDGVDYFFSDGDGDTLVGGKDNDRFYVSEDANVAFSELSGAGSGFDTVYGSVSGLQLDANVERLILEGTAQSGFGTDQAAGLVEYLYANSTLASTLRALGGNDYLFGGSAGDTLDGGLGLDRLYGGGGVDFLDAGGGIGDQLRGEGGLDFFVFDNAAGGKYAYINDWAEGETLDLRGSGVTAGQVNISQSGADTLVTYSIGSGTNTINLLGIAAATITTGDDFLFV